MQQYAGSGYVSHFGMPQEFDDQLFTNIQSGINRQKGAARQEVLDNTSRFPGMSGVQQGQLQGVNRQYADMSADALSGAELRGAQEGLTDRRKGEEYNFTAGQNQANRDLQKNLTEQSLAQSSYQFGAQRQDALRDQLLSLLGVAGGAVAGPALGGLGKLLQNKVGLGG